MFSFMIELTNFRLSTVWILRHISKNINHSLRATKSALLSFSYDFEG